MTVLRARCLSDSDLRLQSELRVQQGFGRFDRATVSRKRQQTLRLRLLDVAGDHSALARYTAESACTNLHTKGQVHEGKIQDVSTGKGVLVPGQRHRETGDSWDQRSGGRASSAPCEERSRTTDGHQSANRTRLSRGGRSRDRHAELAVCDG